jgi:hypothetical protein
MSWKEQLDQNDHTMMTNVNTQLAVLQFKVDTLETLALVGKAAKEDHVFSQLSGLMELLVIRAENMNQSTHEFNEFKKQQEIVNDSMQKAIEKLKNQLEDDDTSTDDDDDSDSEEIASLKIQLSQCQKSEERARIELARKTDELNAERSVSCRAGAEIEEIKELLRKANFACQRKSDEIKDLYDRLYQYEDEDGYPYHCY